MGPFWNSTSTNYLFCKSYSTPENSLKFFFYVRYENKKTIQYLFSGLTSNSGPFKEGSSASTLEHDASLTESEQNATALVMRQPGNCKAAISSDNQLRFIPVESDYQQVQSPKSQSPLPTSSLTYSSSEVQNLEHDKQPFDDTTVHSEDNAEAAGNQKLVAEKERNDSAICGSSDLGSGLTNKHSSSRCGSTSNEAIESSPAVASSGTDPVSESVNYNDNLPHDRTRAENHNTSQREAALVKFRLKRKDRCFEKKVSTTFVLVSLFNLIRYVAITLNKCIFRNSSLYSV